MHMFATSKRMWDMISDLSLHNRFNCHGPGSWPSVEFYFGFVIYFFESKSSLCSSF